MVIIDHNFNVNDLNYNKNKDNEIIKIKKITNELIKQDNKLIKSKNVKILDSNR